jgi:hypothetical protein
MGLKQHVPRTWEVRGTLFLVQPDSDHTQFGSWYTP